MVQAADRRQFGATSTPPSLPAPGWRRDLAGGSPQTLIPEIVIGRAPAGACCVGAPDAPDRPAAAMVLAPALGLVLWAVLVTLFV